MGAKSSLILPILLIVLQCQWAHSVDDCTHHLRSLASKQSLFVQCSTWHSVPVRLCIGCKLKYTEMKLAYEVLKEDVNCTENYFNKDRINIVATTQSILTGLWSKAYCDDCFNSENWAEFEARSTKLRECITNSTKTECVNCLGLYTNLNGFYTSLDQHNNGKVCYDMQDSMNRTRLQWSKEFQCCRRQFNMTLFLVAISLVALLPVIFYGGTFALAKRREHNHDILNADSVFDAEPATAPVVPTPPPPHQEKPKILPRAETDSDDDEGVADIIRKKK